MLEQELFALLEGTADAAFAVDENGAILSWNRAAERLFGYPAGSVLGKACADLFQGTGSLGNVVCGEGCSVIHCATAGHEIQDYDIEVKTRGNRRLWINVSILVVHTSRTGRRLMVHLARNIAERKQKEMLAQKVLGAARELVDLPASAASAAPVTPLTAQEQRVLRLLSEGKSAATVARTLRISPRTLRNHLYHANRKLGTKTRLEAVIHAVRRGLI